MKPPSILSDLQTGAYTTVHMVSVTQPPTLVLVRTTKTELHSTHCVCVCAWSTDHEHERKQTFIRYISAARCTVISVSSQDLSQMLSPFPKTKQCTEREMKPHKHIQNWAACRAAGSPASYATVDIANWDLTCSE